MAATGRWVVKCDDYTTEARSTRESAERLLAQIEAAGHCRSDHEVVEVGADD